MMETLFELRTQSGFCRVFDFFDEADTERVRLIGEGVYRESDLFITRVVTE